MRPRGRWARPTRYADYRNSFSSPSRFLKHPYSYKGTRDIPSGYETQRHFVLMPALSGDQQQPLLQ